MQKKLIALAVAGLASSAAFAQTNVQVYGVVDAAYVYQAVNGGSSDNKAEGHGRDTNAINAGQLAGSRIGFRGTEDLGNGLKALFVLEYALTNDVNHGIGYNGPTALNARQSYVGLQNNVGTLSLGRQYAPGYGASVAMDALVASPAFSNIDAGQAFIGATIRGATPARWNNAVNLTTATFGGFSAQAIYAMGETANELSNGEAYGVGLNYGIGGLAVKYVYQKAALDYVGGAASASQDEHFLGLSYDAKVVKVSASVQTVDRGDDDSLRANNPATARKGEVYQIGAVVPVGRGNIHTGLAFADRSSRDVAAYEGDLWSASVAYTYGLSKRTTLYTGYRYTDQKNGDWRAATATNGETTNGAITQTFAVGINHQF